MLTLTSRPQRRVYCRTIGLLATLALLLTTTITATAGDTIGGPSQYRDCWLGNWERYSECVDANTWGTRFLYPDRDDVALVVGGIPSY